MIAIQKKTTIQRPGRLSLILLSVLPGLLAQQAFAQAPPAKPEPDVIVFSNGDQLTGKLESGTGDSIVFDSDAVGEVTVSLSKIKELRSNEGFVILKNGEKVSRRQSKPAGTISVGNNAVTQTSPSAAPETVPVKDLAYIIDQATYNKELNGKPGPFSGWTGSLTGGASPVEATQER